MTLFDRIRAKACVCGAKSGERCLPLYIGHHADRLIAAGIPFAPGLVGVLVRR